MSSKPSKPYSKTNYIDHLTIPSLPVDVMADLKDAFAYYDKQGTNSISIQEFRNILHNFGFHRTSKKELEDELRRHDIDLAKKQSFSFDDCKRTVGYRLTKGGGRDEEAKDCYKLFDKKDRSHVTAGDIKLIFGTYLKPTATDNEIAELIDFADQSNMGHISMRDFIKFYNS